MAKFAPDGFFDAAFDFLDQANIMHVCSAQPSSYANIAAVSLASVAMTPNADYTKADGDTSGRKVTVAAKSGVTVTASGDATHIVLASTGDSTIRYVTTCVQQTLTAGNTVNIPPWKVEIADPQ